MEFIVLGLFILIALSLSQKTPIRKKSISERIMDDYWASKRNSKKGN